MVQDRVYESALGAEKMNIGSGEIVTKPKTMPKKKGFGRLERSQNA